MRFSALPVNVGDSFLLKVGDRYVLVDGGQNPNHIVDLLDAEKIKNNHIHIIICTHYDSDHVYGIVGILKSRKYSFDELWLPEILGSLAYTISKKLWDILDYLRDQPNGTNYLFEGGILELPYNDNIKPQLDELNNSVLTFLLKIREELGFRGVIPGLPTDLGENLYAACSVVNSALSSGSNVRWFKYMGKLVDYNCGFNFIAKNAEETGITIYSTPRIFFNALASLSVINKESLVFLYSDDDLPNVLFTADSDLSFTNTPTNLKIHSIVTAPHHGSHENKDAYAKIVGNDITYVRSDRSQVKRPCIEYTLNKNKYCTICRNKGPKQKVVLELKNNSFTTQSNKCSC